MTDSLVIFNDSPNEFINKLISGLVGAAGQTIEIILYSSSLGTPILSTSKIIQDEKLDYWAKGKDHRIYSTVLDYCENQDVKWLYIPRLLYPEYLLAELNVRKSLNTRISFSIFGYPDIERSSARAKIYHQLLDHSQISKMFAHSIAGDEAELPKKFVLKELSNKTKLKQIFDPIYEDRELYQVDQKVARSKYQFSNNDFLVLFFGSMFFGKGIDILESSIPFLDQGITCVVASNPKTINFSFSDSLLRDNKRIIYHDRFIPHSEVGEFFAACDLVVLPYRKTYLFDSSGVFVQAALAHRLSLVPNFEPFEKTATSYSIGKTFHAEDPKNLAEQINLIKMHFEELNHFAKYDDYLSKIQSWDEFAKMILNGDKL